MDPNNNIDDHFALPNIDMELTNVCKKHMNGDKDWKKEWAGKELHAIKIHINKDGKFELASSFNNKP